MATAASATSTSWTTSPAADSPASRLPASGPTPSIALRFDGWILPKAGVAFVWVLDSEMAPPSRHDEHLPTQAGS